MNEVRHVVFDIGKVLIHYEPEIPYRRLIPDPRHRAWFLNDVCSDDWNLEQDRGRSWREAEEALIAHFPDEEENIRAFRRHWREMVPHAYRGSVDILNAMLAAGRDVTMLTNFASDTFREAQAMYPFLRSSRGVTVSGDIGIIKPDPAIYAHHTLDFGLDSKSTLFIDDSEKNVASARDFGWQAIRFEEPQQLRDDLERYGIEL